MIETNKGAAMPLEVLARSRALTPNGEHVPRVDSLFTKVHASCSRIVPPNPGYRA